MPSTVTIARLSMRGARCSLLSWTSLPSTFFCLPVTSSEQLLQRGQADGGMEDDHGAREDRYAAIGSRTGTT